MERKQKMQRTEHRKKKKIIIKKHHEQNKQSKRDFSKNVNNKLVLMRILRKTYLYRVELQAFLVLRERRRFPLAPVTRRSCLRISCSLLIYF